LLKLPSESGDGPLGGRRGTVSAEPLSNAEWKRRYSRDGDRPEADVNARREAALAAIDKAFAEYKPRSEP
jgi:hypothetical protein